MVTYDPLITMSEAHRQDQIQWDIALANRFLVTGTLKPVVGDYRWVDSLQPLIDRIEASFAATGQPQDVACDTETMTFDPWYEDREIVTIQFTYERGTADVMYVGGQQIPPIRMRDDIDRWSQIKWLLTSPKVRLRGGNFKYDAVWIAEKWGIECTNFKFDSMLVGTLIDENRSNSLNLHAKVYTLIGGYDDEFNGTQDKNHMERIRPDRKMLTYTGGDTDACQASSDVLKAQLLEDPALAQFYVTILHPAARAFEKIERRGMVVDVPQLHDLRVIVQKDITDLTRKIMQAMGGRITAKHRDKIADQINKGKSPFTPAVLKDWFFSPLGFNLKPKMLTSKTEEPSMTIPHLKMFDKADVKLAVADLQQLNIALKTRSTFIDGTIECIRPDNRIHSIYMLFHGAFQNDEDDEAGSRTGRLSAKSPAVQIYPSPKKSSAIYAKLLRQCFKAPPGKVVLVLDFSQGELKIAACLANEETMLNAYLNGLDLHAVTGAKLGGYELDEFLKFDDESTPSLKAIFDKCRSNAKPANFGLLFDQQEAGFQAYSWAQYGKDFSLAECREYISAFFELYPGLPVYHDKMRSWVREEGEVRSPLGRVRHLPHIHSFDRSEASQAERQAINHPIQSTLTDMMCWAIAIIEEEYGGDPDLEVVAQIHDALIAYVPIEDVQKWALRLTEIMSNLPFEKLGWEPQLKFTADAEYGPDWATLTKIKMKAA